jgi:protein O-mannosyl-transferase
LPVYSKYLPFLIIACLVVLVYFRSIFFGFTFLDDNVLVLDNNPFLQDLKNVPLAFVQEVFHTHNASAAYYRPVLTISFMLDTQIGGMNPHLYHVSNIIFHGIASCLAFLLLIELGVSRIPALCLSCIFAVHPVVSQAVAWIPGRNDSLLGIFAFLAMITFIKFIKNGKFLFLIGHCIAFSLGLFTKESMILFIGLAAIWYLLQPQAHIENGRIISQLSINIVKDKSKIILLFFVWVIPTISWLLLRNIALVKSIHYGQSDIIGSLAANSPAILLNLGKSLFPVNLSVLPILQDSTLLYGILTTGLFLALAAISFFIIRNASAEGKTEADASVRIFIFGILWFLVFLVPSFIRPNAQYPADFLEHRMYVPLWGLLLSFSQLWFLKRIASITSSSCAVFGGCIIILGLITEIHIGVFSDRLPFWKDAVTHSFHHPLAHKNLGAMYHLDGNMDAAETEYRTALELYPYETMAHNNLGLIYKHRKEYDKAESEFIKELNFNPTYDDAYYNWGLMCHERGNMKDAKQLWLKTLEFNPNHLGAQQALKSLFPENVEKKP